MKTITQEEINAAGRKASNGLFTSPIAAADFETGWEEGAQWAISLMQEKWIPVSERLPEVGDKVLIVIDVRKWDAERKIRVETASVGFFDTPTRIGGPISLTGYKTIEGIYFAIPAIMHPESVTHWMPLPSVPQEGGNNE